MDVDQLKSLKVGDLEEVLSLVKFTIFQIFDLRIRAFSIAAARPSRNGSTFKL